MPAKLPIAWRPDLVSVAFLVAGAVVVVACSSPEETTADQVVAPATTAPALALEPEAGALRTTVVGLAPDEGDGPDDVLLVGDSVLVLVADDLARRVGATLRVDAADCRRIDQAVTGPCGGVPAGTTVESGITSVLDARAAESEPPDAAVFVLANNSSITRDDLDAIMAAVADVDDVWWVNTRIDGFGRQDPNNALLAELTAADPRAGLVDWHGASEGKSWLVDNVHPNDDGQVALAELIDDRLRCGCTE